MSITSTPAAGIALLAPVPELHLISALEKCDAVGKVAFGSRAFSVFRELDIVREGHVAEVYIYAVGFHAELSRFFHREVSHL